MELFFHTGRDSFLHRLDGLTKLALMAGNCALGMSQRRPAALAWVALFVLAQLALARSLRNLRRGAVFLLAATLFTVFAWTVTGRGPTRLFLWVTREGLVSGTAAALRIDAFILAGLVFLSTARNEEMIQALRRLRVPYPFCFAVSIALRLAPTFVGTGMAVRQAQKTRGLDPDSGTIPERLRKNIPLLVPTFLSTIRMTGQLAMSLESKGFGLAKDRTFLLESRPGWRDAVALTAMAAAIVLSWNLR